MISILTGTDKAILLAVKKPADIAGKWQQSLAVDVGEEFRGLKTVEYWQCPKTGFRWYTPAVAAGGSGLYAQLEKFDWYYMADKWEFSTALNLLGKDSSVLEIGVGEGHFLAALRKYGHSVQGVELNSKAAARARAQGFIVHEIMLKDLKKEAGRQFDTICSFQVLEHVSNPREFIEEMLCLLRRGGKLILSVPNFAVMKKIDPHNESLLNQPPHHMGHWDENVFRALEALLPLKLRSVHREPLADYHVGWMTISYLRNMLSPLGKNLSRALVNRYTTWPLQRLLQMGLRKYLPGHTLLVEFEYLPS